MSTKPILFNTDMKSIRFPAPAADEAIRALLANRKTVTRRVVKPQPFSEQDAAARGGKPPYRPGDILYVRETWMDMADAGYMHCFKYKADQTSTGMVVADELGLKWRPSTNMPREAARIFLRVTDVRVERLQDIDDGGVVAEGLEIGAPFDEIWDKTIKPADRALYGWDANPWVWVIEFERCEKPGKEG